MYRTGSDGWRQEQETRQKDPDDDGGEVLSSRTAHLLVGSSEDVRSGAFARRPHGFHRRRPQQVSDQIKLR